VHRPAICWIADAFALRKRKAGIVEAVDPDAGAKKS
jgi:hypothetical protein